MNVFFFQPTTKNDMVRPHQEKKYTKPDQDTNSPCLLLEANSKSVNECGGF